MSTPVLHPLYVFRHGLARRPGQAYGDEWLTADVIPEGKPPITALGVWLAEAVARTAQLPPIGFVSPVKRCQQTVALVDAAFASAHHTPIAWHTEQRITEYWPEAKNESFVQLHTRVEDFVERTLRSALAQAPVCICTHGGDISALTYLIQHKTYQEANLLDYTHPGELLLFHPDGAGRYAAPEKISFLSHVV
jgi:broad specificity phosphatase PhoE